MNEPGFMVTDLGSSVGAKGVKCSPGGIWGDYVYIADSGGGVIERVDFFDNVSLFATLDINAFPVGLAFGPGPGANFGDFLYVTDFSNGVIKKITSTGVVSPFTTLTSPGDAVFDPSGAYGNDLFVTTAYSGPIYKVDEFGAAVSWATVPSLYMRFGPGGAWGTGMYATSQSAVGLVTIDVAGVATNFSTGYINPEGFDWAYGTPFNGDMFATDVSDNKIWRVQSDGTRTLFADMPGAADVAFCDGALYAVGFHGGCYKIEPETPVAVAFTNVLAQADDNTVRVTWDVFADEDMLGFVVYRTGDSPDTEPKVASGLLGTDQRAFTDQDVRPGNTYRYHVTALMPDGREISSTPAAVTLARVSLTMAQNYPNPFNPTTTIEYVLSEDTRVVLSVYDGKGRRVVDLENGARTIGTHQVSWDGRDAQGEVVASGIYFYRLTAGNRTLTRKLVLLK